MQQKSLRLEAKKRQAYGSQGTLGARYYTMITDFKNLFVKDFQSLTVSQLHR